MKRKIIELDNQPIEITYDEYTGVDIDGNKTEYINIENNHNRSKKEIKDKLKLQATK